MLKKSATTLLILVGLIAIQACGRHMPKENACNFVTNSKKQRVSWKNKENIKIYIDDSVPEHFWPPIRAAADAWNEKLKDNNITILADTQGGDAPKRDGYSVIYLMETWESEKSTEQARTTVYWSGNRIYEADVRINDKDFEFYLDTEDPDYTKVHLESLMIHELGHVLGLAHNEADESVMKANLNNGTSRNTIVDPDTASLQCEYP